MAEIGDYWVDLYNDNEMNSLRLGTMKLGIDMGLVTERAMTISPMEMIANIIIHGPIYTFTYGATDDDNVTYYHFMIITGIETMDHTPELSIISYINPKDGEDSYMSYEDFYNKIKELQPSVFLFSYWP